MNEVVMWQPKRIQAHIRYCLHTEYIVPFHVCTTTIQMYGDAVDIHTIQMYLKVLLN